MVLEDETISVDLGPRSYEIPIVSHQLADCASVFERWWYIRDGMSSAFRRERPPSGSIWVAEKRKTGKPKALIVTDTHVFGSHAATVSQSLTADGWECEIETLQAGETSKSFEVVSKVHDRLIDLNADRRTIIIAVGGGVVGDTAGFVAATFMRGVPLIQVPTTLLSAVDSSVGGKTGVNHPKAKNMIGAFYQPIGVYIDTATLKTLPEREYRAGLAEVVKYGVILDSKFFAFLESHVQAINGRDGVALRHVIAQSCRLKARVVEQDEFELTGIRASLNYGHTFGHAFEALAGYGELLHGEAVAIGMVHASRLAERLGLIDSSITHQQIALLKALHLPTELPKGLSFETADVLGRMRLDKKTVSGKLRFILPTKIGSVQTFADVPETEVIAVLKNR